MLKTLKIVLIGSSVILTVVFIKYKPAYEVTLAGEKIGFVEDKEFIENKINKFLNDTSGNIAFRELNEFPEYKLMLVNREKETAKNEVILAVQNSTITTYRTYAVTADGEQKAIVESEEEAEKIVNEIKEGLVEGVDLKLGITEVYETEYNVNSEEEALTSLNELKVAKVEAYKKEKAEQERIKKQKAAEEAKAKSVASTTRVAATGSISGMALSIPVNGTISSRFGAVSSSRSSAHTGLDIATSAGTGIRPIAPGTVTYAGYKGSYGNLVIINHGNGIESYYAHCNSLYVSVGQTVDTNSTIAAVGSTGNSTGPHLHLEIRINGTPMNPQNYLY